MSDCKSICIYCLKPYKKNSHAQKACPLCAIEVRRDQERMRRRNKRIKSTLKEYTRTNQTLTELSVEAKRAGMSYGGYVAQLEYGKRS